METQALINYRRIAQAIAYVQANFKEQPSLEKIAAQVHLSPAHFQRMFTEWAGTSPKKFLQYISVEHAKKMLKVDRASLFDTTLETGLSSTSRLHDLFVNIEGMTPAEYKNGGENLHINYSFSESPFGMMVTAATAKGLCYMAFEEHEGKAWENLKEAFPHASFLQKMDLLQQRALAIFQRDSRGLEDIKLHLKGTAFQLKVWECLLRIPQGALSTYARIAEQIGSPKAPRAVGTAIGNNPVAFLIPCHRVIQSSGTFGGYKWGMTRKTAIIAWESAHVGSE